MNNTHRYQLIDGTFPASDAAQVLLALVRSKMDFHEREKLSNQERLGADVAHSERRLDELRRLHVTLKALCAAAATEGKELQVKGWIEVTLAAARSTAS